MKCTQAKCTADAEVEAKMVTAFTAEERAERFILCGPHFWTHEEALEVTKVLRTDVAQC